MGRSGRLCQGGRSKKEEEDFLDTQEDAGEKEEEEEDACIEMKNRNKTEKEREKSLN